jgi:hypothetical protein
MQICHFAGNNIIPRAPTDCCSAIIIGSAMLRRKEEVIRDIEKR